MGQVDHPPATAGIGYRPEAMEAYRLNLDGIIGIVIACTGNDGSYCELSVYF
jgi:hypothetical protein